jgi:branched-chain amino acid transport system substrate-binding protein
VRRINLRAATLAVAAIGLVVSTTACHAERTGPSSAAAWCGKKIGIFGAFAGGAIPSLNGVQLRFREWNDANPNCKLELVEFDSGGSGDNAAPWARTLAADRDVLGVIGGQYSGETAATQPIFQEAGIAMIGTTATRVDLTQTGYSVFHRVNGHDGTLSAAIGTYLKAQSGVRAFVIDDGTSYGTGLADELVNVLGSAVPFETERVHANVKGWQKQLTEAQKAQFDTAAAKVMAYNSTHVFYAGYALEGAPLFRQIRAAGSKAQLIGADGIYDNGLYDVLAGSTEGVIVTCPCSPAGRAGGTFAADFEAEFGSPPGFYAAEAYDAATIFITAITGGAVTREAVLAAVDATNFEGASKHVKFDSHGDVDPSVVEIWAYKVTADGLEPIRALAVN